MMSSCKDDLQVDVYEESLNDPDGVIVSHANDEIIEGELDRIVSTLVGRKSLIGIDD